MYNACYDNQTPSQKERNYKFLEVCSAPEPVLWQERPHREFPIRNQSTSMTCVCQTMATEMGIISKQKYDEFIDFSASFPYKQRGGNYGGCSSDDIYSRFPKLGNIFESIMPSQNLKEFEIENLEMKKYYSDLAKPFSIKRVELPVDFETVASTIQATGKGVMVWFSFTYREWTNEPTVMDAETNCNHSVTAIDCVLKNGKKYLVIQDSWGPGHGLGGYRYISEEFFAARCFLASYLKSFQTLIATEDTIKPKFDGSVRSLQECLIYEGLLAVGLNTGYFGSLTRKALIQFQLKYGISPALGNFGPVTKSKLATLYS